MDNIYVTHSSLPPIEDYVKELEKVWDTHLLTNMGTYHKQLEKSLIHYLGVDQLSLFVNGHMALELSLQALQLKGEVITTPYTFASTTHAIVRNGLTPVFCDIKPDDYTIDVDKIEALINKNTVAILPVHVYGNVCHVEKIQEIADRHNLKVIYDAAHAFGVKYKGVGIGKFGDASMFSFHATKVFNTIEGGAVTFGNTSLGEDLYRLKNFGIRSPEVIDAVGSNAKMNEFQAIMGLCNLQYIDSDILKRKEVYERYQKNLAEIDGLILPNIQKDVDSNYAYFPIQIEEEKFGMDRNNLFEQLKEYHIFTRKYFYPLTKDMDCYRDQYEDIELPIAQMVANRILTLPLYADLTIQQVDYISESIIAIQRKRG